MSDNVKVTNQETTFESDANADFIVDTEDIGGGVHRQRVIVTEVPAPSGTQDVDVVGNTAGIATQVGQAALLAELSTKADLSEVQPASVSSLPLPAGAATEAKQDALISLFDNELVFIDSVTTLGMTYIGWAEAGSDVADAVWLIARIDETTFSNLQYAAGDSSSYNQKYSERDVLGYS